MEKNNFKDYYEILEVHQKASQEVVKKAYTILAKKYHPDVNQENIEIANKKMTELNEAYEILSDRDKRQRYDMLHGYINDQLMNWNYSSSFDYTNKESYNAQYSTNGNHKSNIVKPSNISKRYKHTENNKKLTILTYSVIAIVVVYSLMTNLM